MPSLLCSSLRWAMLLRRNLAPFFASHGLDSLYLISKLSPSDCDSIVKQVRARF